VLGTPYLKVTRVRFQGAEQVEVTNLGGGPQDLAGWTLRSPAQGAVYRLPGGVLLQPGQTCTLFTATGPPLLNPGRLCRAFTNRAWAGSPGGIGPDATDVWPDGGGDVVLFYDALDLPGDHTRYSADPADQPPPPNLRLVGTVQQVAAPGRATLPPFGSVRFSYFVPCPPVVPGQPVPSCGAGGLREVVVMSASRETAEVTYDPPAALTITVPAGLLVRDVGAERSECDVPTEPNVLVCRIPGYGNVGPFESPPLRFTTNAPPTAPGQPQ